MERWGAFGGTPPGVRAHGGKNNTNSSRTNGETNCGASAAEHGGGARQRGNIETLRSGSLRVRVYAGVDVLNGRDLYLKETIPAGPDAREQADAVRDKLIQQIDKGRQPRTNASLNLLIEKHLDSADIEKRSKQTLRGYHRKHIEPTLGTKTAGTEIRIEALETFYAELRRCRDHCDGTATVKHYTTNDHRCTPRCKPHVCKGLADWTIRKIHFMISAAYETGIRWEWLSVNPTTLAKKPAPPPPISSAPSLTPAAIMHQTLCGFPTTPFRTGDR